jgi:hypothetical protein
MSLWSSGLHASREHTEVLLEALCGVAPDETKRMHQDGVV